MEEKNITEVRQKLSEVNKLISPYQLDYVEVDHCDLLEKNAHYMDKPIFERLTENIKEDGFLSQLPFALKKDTGRYLILSGNHRVKAAKKAGLKNILLLFVEGIDKEKQLAYQLSHNSLVGKDDAAILKDLFDEITSIENKEYSGLNELDFPDFKADSLPTINEKDIELHEIKFMFTNIRAEQVNKLLEVLEEQKVDLENTRIVNIDFKEFIRVLTELKKHTEIKSNTVAFLKMLEIVQNYMEEVDA